MSVNIVILYYIKNICIQLYQNLFSLQEGRGERIYIYIYPDVFFFSSSCTECVGMLTVVPVAHICIYSELWI